MDLPPSLRTAVLDIADRAGGTAPADHRRTKSRTANCSSVMGAATCAPTVSGNGLDQVQAHQNVF